MPVCFKFLSEESGEYMVEILSDIVGFAWLAGNQWVWNIPLLPLIVKRSEVDSLRTVFLQQKKYGWNFRLQADQSGWRITFC